MYIWRLQEQLGSRNSRQSGISPPTLECLALLPNLGKLKTPRISTASVIGGSRRASSISWTLQSRGCGPNRLGYRLEAIEVAACQRVGTIILELLPLAECPCRWMAPSWHRKAVIPGCLPGLQGLPLRVRPRLRPRLRMRICKIIRINMGMAEQSY